MFNTLHKFCQSEKEYTISEKNLSGIFRNKTRPLLTVLSAMLMGAKDCWCLHVQIPVRCLIQIPAIRLRHKLVHIDKDAHVTDKDIVDARQLFRQIPATCIFTAAKVYPNHFAIV